MQEVAAMLAMLEPGGRVVGPDLTGDELVYLLLVPEGDPPPYPERN